MNRSSQRVSHWADNWSALYDYPMDIHKVLTHLQERVTNIDGAHTLWCVLSCWICLEHNLHPRLSIHRTASFLFWLVAAFWMIVKLRKSHKKTNEKLYWWMRVKSSALIIEKRLSVNLNDFPYSLFYYNMKNAFHSSLSVWWIFLPYFKLNCVRIVRSTLVSARKPAWSYDAARLSESEEEKTIVNKIATWLILPVTYACLKD